MILALDTGSDLASVALGDQTGILSFAVMQKKRSAEGLLGAIDEMQRNYSAEYGAVSTIALNIGPGSYTGIRVGLALAQGLSIAKDLPVTGVSSLLIRLLSGSPAAGDYDAAIPSREGEVLYSRFRLSPGAGQTFDIVELEPITARSTSSASGRDTDARDLVRTVLTVGRCDSSQYLVVPPGAPISALYGKPVQAKTLAERGVSIQALS